MNNKVIRTERGWAGHFICSDKCAFRRNTLLAYNEIKIVISTVGLYVFKDKVETVGSGRYYETMAFYADKEDQKYHDADVTKQLDFDSDWRITEIDKEVEANEMHEKVVDEFTSKLINDSELILAVNDYEF